MESKQRWAWERDWVGYSLHTSASQWKSQRPGNPRPLYSIPCAAICRCGTAFMKGQKIFLPHAPTCYTKVVPGWLTLPSVGCPASVVLPPDYKSWECWVSFSSPCIFSRMKSMAEIVAGGDRRGRDKITLSEDQKGAERTRSCFLCLFLHLWDAPLRGCYFITWGNKFDLKLLIFTVSFP